MFSFKSIPVRTNRALLIRHYPATCRLLTFVLISTASSALATTYTWNNAGGGAFETVANWSPNGLPGPGDPVIFGNPTGSYGVTFAGSVTNTGLQVSRGTPTLALTSGQTYTISGSNGFTVGTIIGQTANLQITGGTLSLTNDNLGSSGGLGPIQGATGNLTVDGSGTSFMTGTHQFDIGLDGTGTLTVQNGAAASIGGGAVGRNSTGIGTINVTGSGSSLTMGSNMTVGDSGTGIVNVGDGTTASTASIGTGLIVGNVSGSHGAINVKNSDSLTFDGTAAIGNGSGTSGALIVNSGGTLTSNGNVSINTGGTATLSGTWNQIAGMINVAGGALNLNGGSLSATAVGTGINATAGSVTIADGSHTVRNLTRTGTGILTLSGGNVTVTGTLGNGNTGLSVDGSSASVNPVLILDSGATASGITNLSVGSSQRGVVDVFGGSTLNASSLSAGLNAGGSGNITVNGNNSKIQLNGGGTSYIGYNGTGSLHISGAASVNTNGGSVTAGFLPGSSGTIDIEGGTLALGSGILQIGIGGSFIVHNGGNVTQTGNAFIHGVAGAATIKSGTWTANSISVGDNHSVGSLTIQNNGVVNSQYGGIGYGDGNGTVNIIGGSWTSTGGFEIGDLGDLGTGIIHIKQGGSLVASGTSSINLYTGGTLDIAGGTVNTSSIGANGGQISWSSGSLTVNGAGGLWLYNATFGNSVSIDITKKLFVTNTLMVPSGQSLSLAGGDVTAGEIAGQGTFNLQTGNLTVEKSGVSIGVGGPFGALVTAGPGLNLRVTGVGQTLSVATDGVLNLTGGTAAGTSISNAGEINFANPIASLGLAGQTLTNTGRLTGTGRINANLANNANGLIFADSGQRLVFAGTTNNNNSGAAIELTGGTVEFTGTLNNLAGGIISGSGTLRGSTANASGNGLVNNGIVAFSSGINHVFGTVDNQGGAAGGQIINAGGSTLTFHSNVVHNGQEIRTPAGGRTVFLGAVSGVGPFTGAGTVEIDGNLSPGNSTARVTFGGDVVLGYGTNLQIEIGGTSPGAQFDQLQVAGKLSLDGKLSVSLIPGFSPVSGNNFDILDWTMQSGMFSTLQLEPLSNGLIWDTSQLYTSGKLSVVLGGNFNQDNGIDAADYVVWRKRNGTQVEYDLWRMNFGKTPPGGGSGFSFASVPEPTSLGLLFVALCLAATPAPRRKLARAGHNSR